MEGQNEEEQQYEYNENETQEIITNQIPQEYNLSSKDSTFVMDVSPSVVGWIIGRSGLRIKEIQSQTGCKMWLDQDVPDDQPRKIFFHGSTISIEHAVQRVSELVQTAPILANTKIAAGYNLTSVIFDCPPPLVGMVIGKKGWTIKKIQEISGAQISINQSVREGLPRKVIVSGDEEAVHKALDLIGELVRDKAATLKIELPVVLTSGRTNLQPLRTQSNISRQNSSSSQYHAAGIHQDTYLIFADHDPDIEHHINQFPPPPPPPPPQQTQQQLQQSPRIHNFQQQSSPQQSQNQLSQYTLPPLPPSSQQQHPPHHPHYQQQQQQQQLQLQLQQYQPLQGPQFEVTHSPINAAEHPSFFSSNTEIQPQSLPLNRNFLGQRSSTFDNIIVPFNSTTTTTTSSSSSIRPQEAARSTSIPPRIITATTTTSTTSGISSIETREIRTSVSEAHLPLSSPQNQNLQQQQQQNQHNNNNNQQHHHQQQQQQNQQQVSHQQQIINRSNSSNFFQEGFNNSKNSSSNYAQHVQHFQQQQQNQQNQNQQQQQQYLYLDNQSLSRVYQTEKPDIIPSSRQPFRTTSIGSVGHMYELDEEIQQHQQLQLQQQQSQSHPQSHPQQQQQQHSQQQIQQHPQYHHHHHHQQQQQQQSTIWTSSSTSISMPSTSITGHYESVHDEPRMPKRRPSGGSQRLLFGSLALPEPSPRSIGRGFSFASSKSEFPSFETTTDTSSVSLGTPDSRSLRSRHGFFPMTRSSEGFTSGEYSDTEYQQKLQRGPSPTVLLDLPSRHSNPTNNRNMEGNR